MGVHPIGRHPPGNRRMFQVLTSQLIDAEASTQAEVIRAFGVPKASVARAVRRYREGGIAAFFGPRRGRRGGTVLTPDVLDEAQRLLNDGCEAAGVAEELGVKPNTLGKALRDGRLREAPPCLLADKSSRSVRDAAAAEGLGTACTRVGERVLAAMGKLHGRRPASSPAWMFRTAGFCAPCRRWWPTGCSPASTGS
jgi:transposase